MRDTKLGATFLFATLATLTFASEAIAGTCKWRVEGDVKVLDNLWAAKADPKVSVERGLEGAKVRIMAATLPGLFVPWGEVEVDKKGHYEKTVTPAESDPIGCALPRFFRVVLVLENTKVKIAPEFPPLAPGLPAMFPAWVWPLADEGVAQKRTPDVNGMRTAYFSKTFSELKDPDRTSVALLPHKNSRDSGLHNMTRAAQMFWGYQRTYDKMLALKLEPIKVNVVWPSGVGSKDDRGFSDPVIDHTRIRKSWFWSKNDWAWVQTELTHEYVHQWFNAKVYEPGFLGGKEWTSTHDFKETPALTFYEEAAEFLAVGLNQATFSFTLNPGLENFGFGVRNPGAIYSAFAAATFAPDGKPDEKANYYDAGALKVLINGNSDVWLKDLDKANVSVRNYLRLLVLQNWHGHEFGSNYLTTPGEALPAEPGPKNCKMMPAEMFTFPEVARAMLQWKGAKGGRSVKDQSLSGFYEYLAGAHPKFAPHRELFHALGNPHFAQKGSRENKNAWDDCPRAAPLPKAKFPKAK